MVMLLYSQTRIGTEHGFRQLFSYGSPCVTEKPIWPHGVSYQAGPEMFHRSSPPARLPICALAALGSVARPTASRKLAGLIYPLNTRTSALSPGFSMRDTGADVSPIGASRRACPLRTTLGSADGG